MVYAENAAGMPPTDGECQAYASAKGIDPYLTFAGESAKTLFTYVNNYGEGGFGVPWNLVMTGSSMEYYWSSTAGAGGYSNALDELSGN
jgi:hypothetical protein